MENRYRSIQINVRLDKKEYDLLMQLCEKSGRNQSDLIRNMIKGYRLTEKPSSEFYEDMNQVRRLNANVNQIRVRLHNGGNVSEQMVENTMEEIRTFLRIVQDKYIFKEKYDNTKVSD